MTSLGPDCDPDLFRGAPSPPPGPRSALVLLALLAATAYLAVGGFSLWLAVPAGAVALLSAWALVRRAVRLVRGAVRGRPVSRLA